MSRASRCSLWMNEQQKLVKLKLQKNRKFFFLLAHIFNSLPQYFSSFDVFVRPMLMLWVMPLLWLFIQLYYFTRLVVVHWIWFICCSCHLTLYERVLNVCAHVFLHVNVEKKEKWKRRRKSDVYEMLSHEHSNKGNMHLTNKIAFKCVRHLFYFIVVVVIVFFAMDVFLFQHKYD